MHLMPPWLRSLLMQVMETTDLKAVYESVDPLPAPKQQGETELWLLGERYSRRMSIEGDGENRVKSVQMTREKDQGAGKPW